MARPRPAPPDVLARVPAVFEVGRHTLRISMAADWRWSVTVDGGSVPGFYLTQVEAWEAGVREATRIDGARVA